MASEFAEKFHTPTRDVKTVAEYLALPKSEQDERKDQGGFVGGTLAGGRRKAGCVTGRDVLTLDLDNCPDGSTNDVLRRLDSLGCFFLVYSTRKHRPDAPRLRVLFLCDRTVTADEYEPLLRKIAESGGLLPWCDPTTFEAHRLMYWPSCCADGAYIFQYADKPALCADGVLSLYQDWRNVTEWPPVPGAAPQARLAAKQGDPTVKPGVVGAFCRVYDVPAAMDTFILGVYDPCDSSDRYTYTGGSTTGGAVLYDNGAFLYSHHATDPCGGKLVNAFDMVRLHKFEDLDDEAKAGTPTNRLPSYAAMCELAVSDNRVSGLLAEERYQQAASEFNTPALPEAEPGSVDWLQNMEVHSRTGLPLKTIDNVLLILENDPQLKDKMAFDEFSSRIMCLGALPWASEDKRRMWAENDDAGFMHYLERAYRLQTSDKYMYAAMSLCAHKHKINDVKDYLDALPQWDGQKRLDTLLTAYLGAEDTSYTRAVSRKSLVAAVARIMKPGEKYDTMPIFAGPQGIGKSSFLRILGGRWYSDSLQTFEGKEASELLQGTWINELGELNGLTRSESNAVKQFLSKSEDIYREPYGRRTGVYPRRCVFFGTTNDTEFLKDRTGNRRFWPVDVGVRPAEKSVFRDLPGEVPQIWAEAIVRWRLGEALYLSGEVAALAIEAQESHRESSAKEGLIREFLSRQVPVDWAKRNLEQRRIYWAGEFLSQTNQIELRDRDRVCAAEIWCECFNSEIRFMKRADTVEINSILSAAEGWKRHSEVLRYGFYGSVKGGYTKQ